PRPQLLWKPAARKIAREGLQTFPRLRFENINSHDSTFLQLTVHRYVSPAAPQAPLAALYVQTSPDIRCTPEPQPPRRSRGPQPAPGQIRTIHTARSSGHRRERDWSLCHRRLHVSRAMAADGSPPPLFSRFA